MTGRRSLMGGCGQRRSRSASNTLAVRECELPSRGPLRLPRFKVEMLGKGRHLLPTQYDGISVVSGWSWSQKGCNMSLRQHHWLISRTCAVTPCIVRTGAEVTGPRPTGEACRVAGAIRGPPATPTWVHPVGQLHRAPSNGLPRLLKQTFSLFRILSQHQHSSAPAPAPAPACRLVRGLGTPSHRISPRASGQLRRDSRTPYAPAIVCRCWQTELPTALLDRPHPTTDANDSCLHGALIPPFHRAARHTPPSPPLPCPARVPPI
jgi:hypothetical protein